MGWTATATTSASPALPTITRLNEHGLHWLQTVLHASTYRCFVFALLLDYLQNSACQW